MRPTIRIAASALVAAALPVAAAAQDPLGIGIPLEGSFGDGGFTKYVPPINNLTINETPYITTELRPFYAYHDIPNDFVTGGGHVNVIAGQARIALTERLGFIATTDGYDWVDFEGVLPDTQGFNDLTAGLKYAVVSDPANGTIVTVGARYTAPVGSVDTAGIELNGFGNGFIDAFVTGAQDYGAFQAQASLGTQIALADDNWSYLHGSLSANYEVLPGLYPMLEANFFVPLDGGDQLDGALGQLTGADIVDLGADDPQAILALGGGVRYRLTDNIIVGAGADVNVLADEDHFYGWRFITDAVIHF